MHVLQSGLFLTLDFGVSEGTHATPVDTESIARVVRKKLLLLFLLTSPFLSTVTINIVFDKAILLHPS